MDSFPPVVLLEVESQVNRQMAAPPIVPTMGCHIARALPKFFFDRPHFLICLIVFNHSIFTFSKVS